LDTKLRVGLGLKYGPMSISAELMGAPIAGGWIAYRS